MKLTTCTFMGITLIWWNAQVKTLGVDATYAISWEELKKLVIRELCSREDMTHVE